MSHSLMDIEGIGPVMAGKLKALGIRTTDKLLDSARTLKARKELAVKLDVDEKVVLRWVTLADRMRIKGVGEPYAELLKMAGVDTVKELKYRNVSNLTEAIKKANDKRQLVQLLPSPRRIERWIAQAKELPSKISY